MNYVQRKCNLCSAVHHERLYKIKDYHIVRCIKCGFVFLNPGPQQTPAEIYEKGYFTGDCNQKDTHNVCGWNYFTDENVAAVKLRSRQRLDYFEKFISPGCLLDIGCGIGIFLAEARSRNWTPYGVDVSDFAVHYAREVLRLSNVEKVDVEKIDFETDQFDAISMFHVIEHVLDPKALLKTCHRLLKPGGVLFLETPDISTKRAKDAGINWEYLKIPEHLNYFTNRTLLMTLKDVGFRPIATRRGVESTGLLVNLCGSKDNARRFYENWQSKKWFRLAVEKVRCAKEIYSGMIFKDYDNVAIIAMKQR